MGYLHLKCSRCQRVIRHHSKDVETKTVRICPSCGARIEVSPDTSRKVSDGSNE